MDIQQLLNTPPRRLPSEIPETPAPVPTPFSQLTTQSWDSRNGPRPSESLITLASSQNNLPQTPRTKGPYAPTLTRSDRIRIKTALDFNVLLDAIYKKYGYSLSQIQRAKYSRLTPQVHRRGRKPLIQSPTRQELINWMEESPSRRYIAFKHIPQIAPPRLGLQNRKQQAIRTAFKLVGYGRRVAPKKGFSEDLAVMRERVDFAEEAIT